MPCKLIQEYDIIFEVDVITDKPSHKIESVGKTFVNDKIGL